MKKRIALLMTLLLCLLLAGCKTSEEINISRATLAPAPAGSTIIPLDGATMSVDLGMDYVCLTPDDMPIKFAKMGFDAELMKAFMKENGDVALIYDRDGPGNPDLCVAC